MVVGSNVLQHAQNRAVVVVAIVVVILILPLIVSSNFSLGGQDALAAATASTSSNQITMPWLTQQKTEWQSAPVSTMIFGAQFTSASYANINSYNLAALDANLNMLYSTNANAIRIDIGYAAWLRNNQTRIGLVTSLVNNIRSDGKILIIADAASETYSTTPEPWTQFQSDWIQRVKALASLYQPNYYIIIKEPGWYVPYVLDSTTNPQFQNASDWLDLTQQLISAVQQVSPNTKIGISVAASDISNQPQFYMPFLTGVEKLPGISFIGFDIYNIPAFTNTLQFLQQNGSDGKSVWIAEAWSGPLSLALDPSRSSLDTLWIQVLYYFALEIHAQLISPFFTDFFSSYSTPPTTSQGLVSFFQNRTSVFREYQGIIVQNFAIGKNTSSGATLTISSTSNSVQVSSAPSQESTSFSINSSHGGNARILVGVAIAVIVLIVLFVGYVFLRRRKG
ncbi:MAG: hypothetical protein ACREBS_00950 [Nitrososphaerales archaeon]